METSTALAPHADPAKLARLQYREQHDHPLLPENSTGCQVITKLPTSPPKMQRIKPFSKWGAIGSATLQGTISLVLRHARSTPNEAKRSEVHKKWDLVISEVPKDIILLQPKFIRPFEDFELQSLRLTFGQTAVNDSEAPPDVTLENFKAVHFSIRTTPLAVDPVISGEQSQALWKSRHEAWLATLVDGPTSDAMSGLALPGRLCLARPAGEAAALYKIQDLGPCQGSRTAAIDIKCVRWAHTPQVGVSGFWGSFQLDFIPDGGARRQVKKILTRNEVLVWNVELVEAIGDKQRSRRGPTRLVLTVASLRELARRLPDEYPFPQDIPASHVPQARHEGRAKRRNAESVRNDPSAHVDSSDDDDEFDFTLNRRRQPQRANKAAGSARSAAAAAKEADEELAEDDEAEGGEELEEDGEEEEEE